MPRTKFTRAKSRRSLPPPDKPLDATAREAIQLFSLLLSRGNFTRAALIRYFASCLQVIPKNVGQLSGAHDAPDKDWVPAEVLTRWYLLPKYVKDGQPRALPANGRGITFESLVRQVNRRSDPQEILSYLQMIGAVKRTRRLYVPRNRVVQHRLSSKLQHLHHLRFTLSLLRTLESNARRADSHRLYQFATDGSIPRGQLEDFRMEIGAASDQTLLLADAAMFRRSQARDSHEQSVPVKLGIFMSEGTPLPPLKHYRAKSKFALRRKQT